MIRSVAETMIPMPTHGEQDQYRIFGAHCPCFFEETRCDHQRNGGGDVDQNFGEIAKCVVAVKPVERQRLRSRAKEMRSISASANQRRNRQYTDQTTGIGAPCGKQQQRQRRKADDGFGTDQDKAKR